MYAISTSTSEEHRLLQETFELDGYEFLTDTNLEFGERFGFYDAEKNSIYRGYVGINPKTGKTVIEVDYLIGNNSETVIKTMDEL